jgi:hypothetical protein
VILDGAIDWPDGKPKPAAEGFDLPTRKNDIYDWVRQVRGGVLAGAFTVERHLSATILYFVLGDRVYIPDVLETFDEGLLGPLTFERRINVALMVAAHILPPDEVASLKSDLNDLRSLRNSMAHKPFWLHPELNDEGKVANLVPLIMRGKSPLPLTTALIEQLNVQIAALIQKANDLATKAAKRSLATAPAPEGAGAEGQVNGKGDDRP